MPKRKPNIHNMLLPDLPPNTKRPVLQGFETDASCHTDVIVKRVEGEPEEDNRTEDGNTTPDQKEYTKKLEMTIVEQQSEIEDLKYDVEAVFTATMSYRADLKYFMGNCFDWPELRVEYWPKKLDEVMNCSYNWTYFNCITGRDKWKELPKDAAKEIISSLKGWVVQDDLANIASRIPPNFRTSILAYLAHMTIVKECLELFYKDPFWYLEGLDIGEGDGDFKERSTISSSGAHLNAMYKRFLIAEEDLAIHWRAQTARLFNVRNKGILLTRDPTSGLEVSALIEAKAKQFATARMSNKTFALLLKEESKSNQRSFERIYETAATVSMLISTELPVLGWRTLEDGPSEFLKAIPTEFRLHSKELQADPTHKMEFNPSRLDRHSVIAISRPMFVRSGWWGKYNPEQMITKARVIVEDPLGQPGDWPASDEESQANWDTRFGGRRKNKKKTDTKAAGTVDPSPKAKKKKVGK